MLILCKNAVVEKSQDPRLQDDNYGLWKMLDSERIN